MHGSFVHVDLYQSPRCTVMPLGDQSATISAFKDQLTDRQGTSFEVFPLPRP